MSDYHGNTGPGDSVTVENGLRRIVEGAFAPTDFATTPDDDRKFVVDQPGRILVHGDGDLRDEAFLDIRDRVVDLKWGHDERGLLGLAFHPDYERNRLLYVPGQTDRLPRWNNEREEGE